MRHKNNQSGIIKTIVVVIVAIFLFVYFEDNIKKFLESDHTKEAAKKTVSILLHIWESYLKAPIMFFWDKVVIEILWEKIIKTALVYINNIRN